MNNYRMPLLAHDDDDDDDDEHNALFIQSLPAYVMSFCSYQLLYTILRTQAYHAQVLLADAFNLPSHMGLSADVSVGADCAARRSRSSQTEFTKRWSNVGFFKFEFVSLCLLLFQRKVPSSSKA